MIRRVRCCSLLESERGPVSTFLMLRRGALVEEPDYERLRGSHVKGLQLRTDSFFAQKVEMYKKAHGVPFLISDEQELEAATRHHRAVVKIHERQRLMMPFWFISVSAVGAFDAHLKLKNPNLAGWDKQWHCTPKYDFSYPFGEHHKFNQISASYLHDQHYVEEALCGPTTPSMLLSRFELLEELQKMDTPPKLIPFVMSNTTAYNICRGRVTRDVIMKKMTSELVKLHGKFSQNSVRLKMCDVVVEKIRPVFLPMTKMVVSTAYNPMKLPLFICGATGKTSGPALQESKLKKSVTTFFPATVTFLSSAPFVEPQLAIAWSALSSVTALFLRANVRMLKLRAEMMKSERRLKTTGLLHFTTDQVGYRWTVEDEERHEYEYREELRRRAQKKSEFEERVREESARDEARRSATLNPKTRQRTDVVHRDPLGLYELLGLKGREMSVTQKDISEAFREAARINHPDLQPGGAEDSAGSDAAPDDATAHKKMQRILEAYRILKDPKKRKQYDCGLLNAKDLETSA